MITSQTIDCSTGFLSGSTNLRGLQQHSLIIICWNREKISGLNQGQEDIIRAKEAIDLERETLNMDKKSLANLRSEHSRLKVIRILIEPADF